MIYIKESETLSVNNLYLVQERWGLVTYLGMF